MDTPKTVFVLGAGASKPYGLPTGAELRRDIYGRSAKRLRGVLTRRDEPSPETIEELFKKAQKFAQDFRLSRTPMIDLYLNRNPDLMKDGLRAITMSILDYERNCQYGEDSKNPDMDWYSELLNTLTSDFTSPHDLNLGAADVGFITFNYDRSLENFLYETLTRAFTKVPIDDIIKQINSIIIEHLFGQIAPLPWQGCEQEFGFRKSLEDISLELIDQFAKNISILYGQRNNPKLKLTKEMLGRAERIFFLGFGYAPENMELLDFPEILRTETIVYGTVMGLPYKRIEEIKELYFPRHPAASMASDGTLISTGSATLFLNDCDCLRLLQDYL